MINLVAHAVIHTDGTVTFHRGELNLPAVYRIVGTDCIDIVQCRGANVPDGLWLIVDDEGVLKHLEVNPVASRMYYQSTYPEPRLGVRGRVVLTRSDDDGGHTDLTAEDRAFIDTITTGAGFVKTPEQPAREEPAWMIPHRAMLDRLTEQLGGGAVAALHEMLDDVCARAYADGHDDAASLRVSVDALRRDLRGDPA